MLPPQPMAGGAPAAPSAPPPQGLQPGPSGAPSPSGGSPAPPVVPPQIQYQQQMQQYEQAKQAAMQAKKDLVQKAIQLLRDDKLRGFRVDIETDSTIQQDANEDKAQRTDFVEAM